MVSLRIMYMYMYSGCLNVRVVRLDSYKYRIKNRLYNIEKVREYAMKVLKYFAKVCFNV